MSDDILMFIGFLAGIAGIAAGFALLGFALLGYREGDWVQEYSHTPYCISKTVGVDKVERCYKAVEVKNGNP